MAVGDSPALLEFPCDYQFKVFGPAADDNDFAGAVHRAANSVMPVSRDALKVRLSSGGRYLCVTLLVRLQNRTQLDAMYRVLRQLPELCYLL